MQLEVFWSLLLQADSKGPNPYPLCSLVAHFLLYMFNLDLFQIVNICLTYLHDPSTQYKHDDLKPRLVSLTVDYIL